MSNEIKYGLKYYDNLDDILKRASEADKQLKLGINNHEAGERKITTSFEKEINERRRILEKQKKWQEKLRQIDLANEKKMQADITRNQKEEQRKRDRETRSQQGKAGMFTPAKTIARVGGYIATSTVAYQSIAAMKDGVKAAVQFEKEMSNVRSALGNVSDADMQLLSTMAKSNHIVSQYGISAQETAQGLSVLAKAGLSAKESLVTLEPALQMSIAGDMELSLATEKLIKVVNGFGLTMSSAAKIADYFAYSAAKSPTSITGISDAMRIAAPAAKIFGQSVESAFAVVSSMSFAQLEGAAAGNAYSRMMLRLSKNQKEVSVGLKAYGIDIYDKMTGKLRDLGDIFRDIKDSRLMENFGDAQKILGVYAFKSAAQFTAVVDKVAEFKKGVTDASGAAKEMADIKMDNAAGEWKKLVAQFESLWTANDGIATALKNSLAAMNEILKIGNSIAKSEWAEYLKYLPSIGIPLKAVEEVRNYAKNKEKSNLAKGLLPDNPDVTKDDASGKTNRLRINQMLSGLNDQELYAKLLVYAKSIAESKDKILTNTLKYYESQAYAIILGRDDGTTSKYKKLNQNTRIPETEEERQKRLKKEQDDYLKSEEYRRKRLDEQYKNELEFIEKVDKKQAESRKNKYDSEFEANKERNKLKTESYLQAEKDLEKNSKEIYDIHVKAWKETEDAFKEYGSLEDKQAFLDQEKEIALQSVMGNKEVMMNIEKSFAQQKLDLATETWAKENQVAMAAIDGMRAGYGAFSQAMSDDLQISKAESEQIWMSIKSTAITALLDILMQQGINFVKGLFFKGAETAATVTMAGTIAAAWTPAAIAASIATGGLASSIGLSAYLAAQAGGSAVNLASSGIGGLLGGGGGSGGGGYSIASSGGLSSQPSSLSFVQSQVSGGSVNNNNSLVAELRSLRLAIKESDQNNQVAIASNVPVFPDIKIGDVDIYKSSLKGKKKASFIVSPT